MTAGSENEGGLDGKRVIMYGLTTCGWCKKMRSFLEDETIAFDLIYVDELTGSARDEAIENVRSVNPSVSFPTLVIDGERPIIGYRPDEVKEALGP